mmetsp:Transcript_13943/g.16909  ORF Transcript_13943/g.16909 Transcript_13943/m.16909 type:complete len:233 (+) Transcript_13943:125-823(+)
MILVCAERCEKILEPLFLIYIFSFCCCLTVAVCLCSSLLVSSCPFSNKNNETNQSTCTNGILVAVIACLVSSASMALEFNWDKVPQNYVQSVYYSQISTSAILGLVLFSEFCTFVIEWNRSTKINDTSSQNQKIVPVAISFALFGSLSWLFTSYLLYWSMRYSRTGSLETAYQAMSDSFPNYVDPVTGTSRPTPGVHHSLDNGQHQHTEYQSRPNEENSINTISNETTIIGV